MKVSTSQMLALAGTGTYMLSSGLGFVAEDEIEPVVGEDSRVTMLHLTTSSEPLSRPDCAMVRTDRQLLLPLASFLPDTFVLCQTVTQVLSSALIS